VAKLIDNIARRVGFIPEKEVIAKIDDVRGEMNTRVGEISRDSEKKVAKLGKELKSMKRTIKQTAVQKFNEGASYASRSFAAAQLTRFTNDWTSAPVSPDQDIRLSLRIVRERARDLVKNNDYAKKYVNLVRSNVVGPNGFTLQMDVRGERSKQFPKGVADESANAMIEDAFMQWCEKEYCSINGRFSFWGLQDMLAKYWARDGEAALQKIVDGKFDYGIKFGLVETEAIDEQYSQLLKNGNVVKMGVELDEWKRPLNYYMRRRIPEMELYGGLPYSYPHNIIPADQLIFGFDQEYENQTRGMSPMVQSMYRLRMLTGYEEAAIVNARASASKMGFFERIPGTPTEGFTGQAKDGEGNFVMDAAAGTLQELPVGLKFSPWAPEYPTAQHGSFMKTTLRGIATGLNVSYESLTGDLENVNYSSIRDGKIIERDMWRIYQRFFIETFLKPIFREWLWMAAMKGQIKIDLAKFSYFCRPNWIGRRWEWVDPFKDVEAEILQVQAGFKTATQVIAERGGTLEEIYLELKAEKDLASSLGLKLKVDEIALGGPAAAAIEDPNSDGGTPAARSAKYEEKARELLNEVYRILVSKKNNHKMEDAHAE